MESLERVEGCLSVKGRILDVWEMFRSVREVLEHMEEFWSAWDSFIPFERLLVSFRAFSVSEGLEEFWSLRGRIFERLGEM